MDSLLTTLFSVAAIAATPPAELQYAGALSKLDRSGDSAQVKQFDVRYVVTGADDGHRTVFYLTDEADSTAIAWPERFGRIEYGFAPPQQRGGPIQVAFKHDDRLQVLSLPGPYFEQRVQLAADAEWSTDAMRYHVVGSREIEGRQYWEVDAASTARAGTMRVVVDAESGLIQSGSRRLSMGQGEPYELTWTLQSQREISEQEAARTTVAAESLLELQSLLGRVDAGDKPVLSPAQLETTAGKLEGLQQQAAETPFADLTKAIARDVQSQRQRVASVSELSAKFLGQAAPQFELNDLGGKAIPADSYKGKTLVLHFWDYRDEPLEEPYGQIAYLDFLMNRHSAAELAVYGVAVDRRFNDPATSSQASRSVRRLKSFMNLGYEITADRDGQLLKAFGDPTRFDAKLPLWVVIGPDGTILHYRTGYYEIDREVGLAEIDAIVSGVK